MSNDWTDEYVVPEGAVFEEWYVVIQYEKGVPVGTYNYPPGTEKARNDSINYLEREGEEYSVFTETHVKYPRKLVEWTVKA